MISLWLFWLDRARTSTAATLFCWTDLTLRNASRRQGVVHAENVIRQLVLLTVLVDSGTARMSAAMR
jgi:hypothetical protein